MLLLFLAKGDIDIFLVYVPGSVFWAGEIILAQMSE